MEKKNSISKHIAKILLVIVLIIIVIASCHKSKTIEGSNDEDTVAAKQFTPQVENGKLNIDLFNITSIHFPKYKVAKTTPFIPDSVSLAADEETVASGNYTATLILDTIPNKTFYQRVELAAQHDTCWNINKFAYTYERKDKTGGFYKIVFSKDGQQISVTHLNKDMIKFIPKSTQQHQK